MKRSSFFAALAAYCGIGVAKGQACHSSVRPRSLDYGCKPGSNECPTCGTIAERYGLAEALAAKKKEWCESGYDHTTVDHWCAGANTKTGVPQSRVTRCSYCSAAFYQDGE